MGGIEEKTKRLLWTKTCFYRLDQLTFKTKVKVSIKRKQYSLTLLDAKCSNL